MIFLSLLFACASNDSGLLAIGDSYLEWNADDERSIPHIAGQELGIEVNNSSISGSHFREGQGEPDVPSQYTSGQWDWVVITGGGNDLNDSCECGPCDGVLDELVTTDGSEGVVADLTSKIIAEGHKVVLLGYYDLQEERDGFDNCNELLPSLRERYQTLADQTENLWFVDASQAVTPAEREQYDDDGVHPSIEGSATIGRYLAEQISTF